jgi:hypothetical protein
MFTSYEVVRTWLSKTLTRDREIVEEERAAATAAGFDSVAEHKAAQTKEEAFAKTHPFAGVVTCTAYWAKDKGVNRTSIEGSVVSYDPITSTLYLATNPADGERESANVYVRGSTVHREICICEEGETSGVTGRPAFWQCPYHSKAVPKYPAPSYVLSGAYTNAHALCVSFASARTRGQCSSSQ